MRGSHALWVAAMVAALGLLLALSAILPRHPNTTLAAPVAQPTEQEPNNGCSEALPLGLAEPIRGAISPITDTDWYYVNTTPGFPYFANLQIQGNLSIRICLYAENCSFISPCSQASRYYTSQSWTATGNRHYLQIQSYDPTTNTLATAAYIFEVVQSYVSPTPTPTHTPTRTPIPGATATPTPIPATAIPGADAFEPNYNFDTAATIGVNITYDNLNFIPWAGGAVDNDYYKIWVKPGLLYTCQTSNLAPGVDPNMIVYDGNRNLIGGNDDIILGDYNCRFSYLSTYEGFLYILIGTGNRLPSTEVTRSSYSLRCTMETPGQPTATPVPTATPRPDTTAAPPSSPLPTPTPGETGGDDRGYLEIRPLTTPTPPAPVGTPAPHFVPVDLTIYYDSNDDGVVGAGEGIAGLTVVAYDTATGRQITQGVTDEFGHLAFTAAAQGPVRISIPYLGISHVLREEGTTYIRIKPVTAS